MSKKDYIEIAKALNNYAKARADDIDIEVSDLVDDLSEIFQKDNVNFDKKRFELAVFLGI